MRIFLDDERLPIEDGEPWFIARTVEEMFALIEQGSARGDPVTCISFDHDLGADETEAKHAVQRIIDTKIDQPNSYPSLDTIIFHTANIVEIENMAAKLRNAADAGIFPALTIKERSALFNSYPIDPEVLEERDRCDECELPSDVCACADAESYDRSHPLVSPEGS